MKQAKIVASCGMMAALSIVLLVLGAVLEVGMYAAPMLAGLCLVPIGWNFGKKQQAVLWIAVSLLAFMLVPNLEENLMYLFVFGCYPVIRPVFQRLPGIWRLPAKLLYFNAVTVALELLLMALLLPEPMGLGFALLLLLLGNVTFFCYDLVLPRAEKQLGRRLKKILG